MSKIGQEALYGMFSLSACHVLFGGSWLLDYSVNCEGHDQGQALTFTCLPLPHKYNPRDRCEKILFMSEIRVERTISKSKTLFVLLLVDPNLSEEVTPFHLLIQSPLNDFRDETFYDLKPLNDHYLPLEYRPTVSFNITCDEYFEIFNKLMNVSLMHSIGLRKMLLRVSRTLIC